MSSAGIRNCNPFDLEYSGIKWRGLVEKEYKEGELLKFQSSLSGIRAGMLDAYNKVHKDGLNTIPTFLNKFAPPSENDTEKYINFMVNWMGLPWASATIELDTTEYLIAWAKGIIQFETGDCRAYNEATYITAAKEVLG